MKKRNRQAVFFATVVCLTLLTLFVLRFEMTGYATYPPQIQSDWCNGSDINRDGKVDNSTDFSIDTDLSRLGSFFNNKTCSQINYWCNFSDINRNGEVSGGDMVSLGNNIGKTDCTGSGKNLIQNPDFKIDTISTNGKTIPFFWSKNSEEPSAKYNIINDLPGKVASIEVSPSAKYVGIVTNPIKVKANTMYSLKGLIACDECTTEDFKLFLHVKPLIQQGTNPTNFHYLDNYWKKITNSYAFCGNDFCYDLYEMNIITNNEFNLYAYVIAAFGPGKTGTGYVSNLEFKEINITCTKNNADLNNDGKVNDADLTILSEQWKKYINKRCASPTWCECADIDQNGDVGNGDLGKLASQYTITTITCTKNNADLNNDGKVNDDDLAILSTNFGKTCTGPTWCECADINQDRKVSLEDQVILGQQYTNKTCSELSGYICASDEECPENNWTNALDSNKCCKTTCTAQQPPSGGETPSNVPGSSGTTKQNLKPTATSLKLGYSPTKPLKAGDKITFSIDATTHTFEIISLSTSAMRIRISSTPIEDTISKGQTRKFELTGDHYYDLKVELNDITTSGAKVTLTSIEELITSKQQTSQNTYKKQATVVYQDETGEDLETGLPVWIYIVITSFVIILFIALLLFLAHKRRQRYAQ